MHCSRRNSRNILFKMTKSPAFIIGTPRSGTTLLGRILGLHPRISTWIEPYYVWDYHFRNAPHDHLDDHDASEKVKRSIRNAFMRYRQAQNVDVVIDKSPRNCLRLSFINSVFPESRYIYILRDGRDSILSIYQQWRLKKESFGSKGNPKNKYLV